MDLRLAAADLVLGAACPGCGRPALALCPSCRPVLRPRPVAVPGCRVPTVASADHAGAARLALIAWKERGRATLGPDLARLLATSVLAAAGPGPLVLVPVPTTRRARRARGTDLVLDLARAAAALLRDVGSPVEVRPVLRVVRRVDDQSGLGAVARHENVAGAFGVRRRAARTGGRDVVVVDDVVTTGATIDEAVRALASAGVPVAAAATALRRP